jgi:hypothetical protein
LYLQSECKQDEPDNDNNGNIFSFFVVRLKLMDDCEDSRTSFILRDDVAISERVSHCLSDS